MFASKTGSTGNTPVEENLLDSNSDRNSYQSTLEDNTSEIAQRILYSSTPRESLDANRSEETDSDALHQNPSSNHSTSSIITIEDQNSGSSTEENSQLGGHSESGNYTEASALVEKKNSSFGGRLCQYVKDTVRDYQPSAFTITYVASTSMGVATACANGFSASGCSVFDDKHATHDKVIAIAGALGTVVSLGGILRHRIEKQDSNQNAFVKGSCAVIKTITEVATASLLSGFISSAAVEYRNR